MKPPADTNNLFHRVTEIIEQARSNVVRTVNIQMVIAYWLIGRDIVEEEQHGSAQAGYGDYLIEICQNGSANVMARDGYQLKIFPAVLSNLPRADTPNWSRGAWPIACACCRKRSRSE